MFSVFKNDGKKILPFVLVISYSVVSMILSYFSYGVLNAGRTAAFAAVLICSASFGICGAALAGSLFSALFAAVNPDVSYGILTSGLSGAVCCIFSSRGRISQSALFFTVQTVLSFAAGYSDDTVIRICIDMLAAVIIFVSVPVSNRKKEDKIYCNEPEKEMDRHVMFALGRASEALESARKTVDEISYSPLEADRNIRNRISDITEISLRKMSGEILSGQMHVASSLLRSFVPEIHKQCISDAVMTEKIRKILYDNDIGFTSVLAFSNRYGRMFAEICCSRNSCVNGYSIYKTMSEVFGKSFECSKCYTDDDVRYLISERPRLSIETNISQKCSDGESRNGDTCDCFRDDSGFVYAVISDGMGTGGCAASDSSAAVSVLRDLITGGIDIEHSIDILNSVMLARTEGESFATLDVARFDLDTGTVTVFKCGAAPSFYTRGNSVKNICSDSAPVGILADITPFRTSFSLYEGDVFTMVSDGVPESAVTDANRKIDQQKSDAGTISDEICRIAQNDSIDDISVITVKIMCQKK